MSLEQVLILALLACSTGTWAVSPEDCEDSLFHLDPDNCPHSYYRCYMNPDGGWEIEQHDCPDGTAFNPEINICDWEDNVPDNVCDGITHKPTDHPTEPTEPTTPTEPPTTTKNPYPPNDKRLVCYFGAWAYYRPGGGKFDIKDIDPHLCTHVCYGFANMDNHTWEAVAYDPWYDLSPHDDGCDGDHCHFNSFRRFTNLKKKNPDLKTLISIGGWNTGSGQWSQMAKDPEKRKIFIESSVKMTKTFDFDGIDFDWEYPGDRQGSDPEHDKEHFTLLVEEFSAALHAENKILTAATSPDWHRLNIGVDMPRVTAAIDFLNVMTYDYHGGWDAFLGLNTPLYARTEETHPNHPGYRFNVNDTINYYLDQGAPPEKLNLGTATYGRGFTLPDATKETGLYCPSAGDAPGGPYTEEPGMWGYLEILKAFKEGDYTDTVDGCSKAPYAVNGRYWIGYDNKESIALKAKYANYRGLGGAMIFALDLDDFKGAYGEKYPLTNTVRKIIRSGETLDPEDIIGENSGCESAPICTP